MVGTGRDPSHRRAELVGCLSQQLVLIAE
jgi:hypothetical protein